MKIIHFFSNSLTLFGLWVSGSPSPLRGEGVWKKRGNKFFTLSRSPLGECSEGTQFKNYRLPRALLRPREGRVRDELLIVVLCLISAIVWAASPAVSPAPPSEDEAPARAGTANKAEPPAPPVRKSVDEPVFRMPELVIIGENQARIMAQKERMSGSPLAGLHEAPLLEKEEGTVTALRRRESASSEWTTGRGAAGLLRLEGGTHGFLAGDGWLAFRGDRRMSTLNLGAASWRGEKAGAGYASGWDALAEWGGAKVDKPAASAKPRALDAFMPWVRADSKDYSVGWQGAGRDLPWIGSAHRVMNRGFLVAETSRNPEGYSAAALLEGVWLKTPRGADRGFRLDDRVEFPVWTSGALSVSGRARLGGETARFAGTGGLGGSDVELSWVPDEKVRYSAGLRGDLAGGEGWSAKSLRPLAGISWTTPAGPTLAASLAGGLDVPWYCHEAVQSPYSYFTAAPVPERELANLTVSAWQSVWDDSTLRADFSVREVRRALSWAEAPGQGLYTPAAVGELSVRELALAGRYNGFVPFSLYGRAAWRDYTTRDGLMAGLPRAGGKAGVEWAYGPFRLGAELEVQRGRDRSVAGGLLDPFESLGLTGAWTPLSWLEVFARGDNLTGCTIERWSGYPEPKRLVSGGLLAKF